MNMPDDILKWLDANLLTMDNLVQLGWVLVAVVSGYLLSRRAIGWFKAHELDKSNQQWLIPFRVALRDTFFPLITLVFLFSFTVLADQISWPRQINAAAISLTVAWIIIRFASAIIKNRKLARIVAIVAWTVAAVDIVGALDTVVEMLDNLAFNVGETRLSILTILKGVFLLAGLLWAATLMSRMAEKQIKGVDSIAPSLQVLLSKLVNISLIVFAFLVGLNTIGIDLTALAVFSGALGVGIGFGLQKVVSNFISGIILLMDRSIKPGDIIVVEETYGWVNTLGARHVSVITRDGKEHLIPNELLITEKVENWSYTNRNVRIRLPLGVSYNSDLHKVLELAIEAAAESSRVLSSPKPNCLVRGFGDSAVDLELRVWINDPSNGIGNIMSEIYLNVWDKFQEHGVEIPFPQRDLHIASVSDNAMDKLQTA